MASHNSPLSPQITIVEASAGSGKTYCLASRYVRLLINPALKAEEMPLRDILAITFSNKAAYEMKQRILDFLKKLALDKFRSIEEKKGFLDYLSVDEGLARDKSSRILDEIMRRYNFFQVQTIDSFINAILSACALKFRLSASFKIKRSYREYLSYSFDRFIERANSDEVVRGLFLEFLKQYLHLENKKGWLPKADILSIMEALFDLSNIYGAPFRRGGHNPGELFLKRGEIHRLMLELKKNLPEGLNMQTWGSFVNSFDEETGPRQIERFFNPFSKEEFKMKKCFSPSEEVEGLWEEIKGHIRQLYEWRAFSLYNCYIDIFNGIISYFEEISRSEDILFLSQLNALAGRLLEGQEGVVPELYYRLAVRFRHFLIDEFQDTSLLQWRNLFPMAEEALSTGGSLFYVGDKKQAIYRFRGGEVSLIDEVKKELGQFKSIQELLNRNYRSQKEIVEFNNYVFSRENLRRMLSERERIKKTAIELGPEDIEEITGIFNQSGQVFCPENKEGYVKVEYIEPQGPEDNPDSLKERVISLVAELRQRFELRDIALLSRSNKEVEAYSSWLLEEGIPVESEKTLNIRENGYIKELISFLKFLNSPIDDLSFAAFILGDIFSRASGLDKERLRNFLFRRSRDKISRKEYLYIAFRGEFAGAWDGLIGEFFKNAGISPLYELQVSIMRKFRVLDNFPQYQGFFMKFLELIKGQEEDSPGMDLFLEFFEQAEPEELYVDVFAQDSVKAITIHKSKGLEFPVVIIPSLQIEVKTSSGGSKNYSFLAYSEGGRVALNHLSADDSLKFSPLLKARYLEEYKRAFIDELNSVYVAFTRPKYELYVFVPKKGPRGLNLASLLVPDGCLERGRPAAYKNSYPDKPPERREIGMPVYQDWIGYLKGEFQDVRQVKEREAILRGEALHYLLSRIGNLISCDADTAIKEVVSWGRNVFAGFPDWEDLEAALRKVLSDNSFRPFFFCPDARVFTEKELVNSFGDTRRIDRLVVYPREALVVDYKSSSLGQEEHKAQVREYQALLKEIYPRLMVRGFLIYLDELRLEEVLLNG